MQLPCRTKSRGCTQCSTTAGSWTAQMPVHRSLEGEQGNVVVRSAARAVPVRACIRSVNVGVEVRRRRLELAREREERGHAGNARGDVVASDCCIEAAVGTAVEIVDGGTRSAACTASSHPAKKLACWDSGSAIQLRTALKKHKNWRMLGTLSGRTSPWTTSVSGLRYVLFFFSSLTLSPDLCSSKPSFLQSI